jgi:hypothetical protein
MSSPTTRSLDAPGGRAAQEITDFVAAVRAWLDDLSTDEVTELTGGLEADLTDALAEAGSTPSDLYGDPAKYASELRAAAGLPPRGAGGVQRAAGPGFAENVERNIVVPVREMIEVRLRDLDAQPWWPGVRDFLVVLRPAWWALRAWVAVESLFIVTGSGNSAVRGGVGGLLLLLAVIVLSVQIGRHTPLPVTWQRVTLSAWNLVAVLLLLPVMFSSQQSMTYENAEYQSPGGLNIGGEPVTNVFPYDSAGRPLTGIQLYDQNGRPLEIADGDRTEYDEQSGAPIELAPGSPAGLAPRWNAFPLQQRRYNEDTGELGPVEPAPLPLSGVPSSVAPTEEGTQAPSSIASPSASPSGSAAGSTARSAAKSTARSTAKSRSGAAEPTVRPSATR